MVSRCTFMTTFTAHSTKHIYIEHTNSSSSLLAVSCVCATCTHTSTLTHPSTHSLPSCTLLHTHTRHPPHLIAEFRDLKNTVVTLEVKLGIATMGEKVSRQTVYQIKASLASANGQLDDLQFEVRCPSPAGVWLAGWRGASNWLE